MNAEDPFLAAQAHVPPAPLPQLPLHKQTNPSPSDILTLLSTTRPLVTSYRRILTTAPSSTSPELLDARRDLSTALDDLTADAADLDESVRAAEADPYAFGLDVGEVRRRRGLVSEVQAEVARMRDAVDASAAGGHGSGLPDPNGFSDDEDMGGEGDGVAELEVQRQRELLEEQDEALEGVFQTVGNLRRQADDMGRELEEQGELLDEVDGLADRVGGKVGEGLRKVGGIVRRNEGEWLRILLCCCACVFVGRGVKSGGSRSPHRGRAEQRTAS